MSWERTNHPPPHHPRLAQTFSEPEANSKDGAMYAIYEHTQKSIYQIQK